MSDDNFARPQGSGALISPPLVSLVLINWNYAAYVGAAIDSIKRQDYPWFEVIVVDNGSTDESREVIARHVGDDPRFRVIHLEKNLGQLGAFLETFETIEGEFVTIVDADDVLFPNFLSSHVQVHLALPRNVALTSSNVVEMTAAGRVLTGSYAPFGKVRTHPALRGLRPPDAALRLPMMSELAYRQLSEATRVYDRRSGWIWGPGTSNMYRRSALALAHHKPRDRALFLAADSYLCRFCHVFGGSGIIDKHLSAYRIHDRNYFAERESIEAVRKDRVDIESRRQQEALEPLNVLLARAEFFRTVLPGETFWRAADQLSNFVKARDGRRVLRRRGATPYSANYANLKQVFGEDDLLAHLKRRLSPEGLRTVLRDAYGGTITPRLRLGLALEDMKSALKRLFHKTSVAPRRKRKREQKIAAPRIEEPSQEFGPAAIFSFDPPIFLSGIAFKKYVGIATEFGKRYGSLPAAFLIYPTWTIDEEERAGRVIRTAKAHQDEYPSHQLVFLCNTAGERDRLLQAGLDAHLLNKNFIVSDRIFRPLPNATIEFDAVYTARFDPRKRHALAGKIPRVAYISFADKTSGSNQDQRAAIARTLTRHPGHALLNPLEDGLPVRLPLEDVNEGLNRAAVGLCLSEIEGSNYASMEYMLAGLPVVSTPSVGGREVYFDHEFCTICNPTPSAVSEAVQALITRAIPRDYIRNRTLAKIEPERRRFLALIDDLSERLGGARRYDQGTWPFGTARSLVNWKEFSEHFERFDKGRTKPPRNGELSLADVEDLLTKTESVQMQPVEVLNIVRAIQSRPNCSLLVFGCGNDSTMWEDVNRGGTTAFIEDDPAWAAKTLAKLKSSRVYLTDYGTRLSDWVSLLNATDSLELDLPEGVTSRRWDVIVVDGPAGYDNREEHTGQEAPGRMKSIYMASKLVAQGGAVFVHDCERLAEQQYADRYLGSHRLFVSVKGRALLQGYAF